MPSRRPVQMPLRLALVASLAGTIAACAPAWETYEGSFAGCPEGALGETGAARLDVARAPLGIEGVRFRLQDDASDTVVEGAPSDAVEDDDGLRFSFPFALAGAAFELSARLQRAETRYSGEVRIVDAEAAETRCTVDVERDLVPAEPDLRPIKEEGRIDDKTGRL